MIKPSQLFCCHGLNQEVRTREKNCSGLRHDAWEEEAWDWLFLPLVVVVVVASEEKRPELRQNI